MDGRIFDELTRAASGTSRRRALGLLGGAAFTAGVAKFDLAAANKGKRKKKRGETTKKTKRKSSVPPSTQDSHGSIPPPALEPRATNTPTEGESKASTTDPGARTVSKVEENPG